MQTSFAEIPDELWERIQAWIPRRRRGAKGARPPIADRRALSGILYRLRTGCQWDAIPSEFGSRSTCYRRFVEWTKAGVFKMMHVEMLLYYDEKRGIDWNWCSLDSASVKAPKGGRTYRSLGLGPAVTCGTVAAVTEPHLSVLCSCGRSSHRMRPRLCSARLHPLDGSPPPTERLQIFDGLVLDGDVQEPQPSSAPSGSRGGTAGASGGWGTG